MIERVICINCFKLSEITDAAAHSIRNKHYPLLSLLDVYHKCCSQPEHYYVLEGDKITEKEVRDWIKKEKEKGKEDA